MGDAAVVRRGVRRDHRAASAACAMPCRDGDRGRRGDSSTSLEAGGKLLVFGNGGSAADAQHMAAELVGRFRARARRDGGDCADDRHEHADERGERLRVRLGVRAADRSARPARGRRARDLDQRRSANVLAALEAAKPRAEDDRPDRARRRRDRHGRRRFTSTCPRSTARVQEVHRTVMHVICELVEGELAEVELATDEG